MALRLLLAILALASAPLASQPAPDWTTVDGGANLIRPTFWDGMPGASAADARVVISAGPDESPVVNRSGPRIDLAGQVRVTASLQADTPDLAALALLDAVPADEWGPAMRRLEIGLQAGQVVVGVFDGASAAPTTWQTFDDVDAPLGPVSVSVTLEDNAVVVSLSGVDVTRFDDPGIFQTGRILFGTRVAAGNQLTLYGLDVQAPVQPATAARVNHCAPARLLAAGEDDSGVHTGIWWVWPDDGLVRQVEASDSQSSALVAASPDARWVTYYQRSRKVPDRYVADTWVIDAATDERYKLVEGNAPLGWMADSKSVVLGERPYLMALVPSGELVPTEGAPALTDNFRAAPSPDRHLRAGVATSSRGAEGVEIVDTGTNDLVMSIPTGRGAVELAWSPDSTRLAYTSGDDGFNGLIWRLRIVDLADRSVSMVDSTRDMSLHSVVWVPPLPGCQP